MKYDRENGIINMLGNNIKNKKSSQQQMDWKPIIFKQIGVTGFEPATSRPPAERATKLRHTPIFITIIV